MGGITMETQVFYHVAGIGHWRDVVTEQLSLLAAAKFRGKVNIGFVGAEYEEGFIYHVAKSCSLDAEIRHFGTRLDQFEFPTQRWMHEVCQGLDPDTPVAYFHSKSVTGPSWPRTLWRWLMNAYVLTHWRTMVESLKHHNCAGVSWMTHCFPASCFPGTFWWATARFVAQLTPVDDYYNQFCQCIANHNPTGFTPRHSAEVWVNSRLNANPRVFGPGDSRFWDHAWWSEEQNHVWREFAHRYGSVAGVVGDSDRLTFNEAFGLLSHNDCAIGSDKLSIHSYGAMYSEILAPYRQTMSRLLEIGVMTGASLLGWQRFLGPFCEVEGIDISLERVRHYDAKLTRCDGTLESDINELLDWQKGWDIIIDDGSHLLEDQIKSYELLFPMVNPRGVYVIEDILDYPGFMARFPEAEIYDTRYIKGCDNDLCAVFRKP